MTASGKPQRRALAEPELVIIRVFNAPRDIVWRAWTDPKKAVVALKWAVREMEERYKKMSKLGVRNIDGYNQRLGEARGKGEDNPNKEDFQKTRTAKADIVKALNDAAAYCDGVYGGMTDIGEILAQADTACYHAKSLGGSAIQVYEKTHPALQKINNEMQWVGAISRDMLEKYVVPIIEQ